MRLDSKTFKFKRLSAKEQNKLAIKAQNGDIKARNALILQFQQMIRKEVKPYVQRLNARKENKPLQDELMQYCSLKIISIINDYDINKGINLGAFVVIRLRGYLKHWLRDEYKNKISTYNEDNCFLDKQFTYPNGSKGNLHEKIADDPVDFDSNLDIETILKDVSKEDINILELYFMEGMTLEEISLMYQTNKMNISRRISKLLKSLKNTK